MADFQLETPVAFLVFNRPDTTERVFAEIAKARPPKLLVVADGPRPDRAGEAGRCALVRAIIDRIDWPCELLRDYSDVNLGCKARVSSGLDWVFSQVDEAIILEDDCLPHPTFFRFCEELLVRYRHDERIMMISGDNFQLGNRPAPFSYYFSRYAHIWGWASWRRAWQNYDLEMKLWPYVRDAELLKSRFGENRAYRYWSRIFEDCYRREINTWDYQWLFACWTHSGLSVVPNVNLVSNIGFGDHSTHTRKWSAFANLPAGPVTFPLSHPPCVIRDAPADRNTEKEHYRINPLPKKIVQWFFR